MWSMNSRIFGSCSRLCGNSAARRTSCGGVSSATTTSSPARQVLGDLEHRLEDDPAPRQRPAGQHVAVVGFERPRDLEALRALRRDQRPDELARARDSAAAGSCAARRPGRARRAACRAARHRRARRTSTRRQSAIGRTRRLESSSAPEQEGDVEPLGGDVDPPVRQPQPHVDLRVEVLERRDQRRDQPLADPERRRDMDRAARAARDVGDRRPRPPRWSRGSSARPCRRSRPARSAAGCGWCG